MIYRTEYNGHEIAFWPIVSSRSLWMASYNYLLVDGHIVAKSGGFCLSASAKGEFVHNDRTVSIEMRTGSASGGLAYELLIDAKIFDYGQMRSSYMKKEPADIQGVIASELDKYHQKKPEAVEMIDENAKPPSDYFKKHQGKNWYKFLQRYGITLLILLVCLSVYNSPPNEREVRKELNQKRFVRLMEDSRSTLEQFSGKKVLMSFGNFYHRPYKDLFIKSLRANGISVFGDDRSRLEDINPLHPSNVAYGLSRGIPFAFSGISKQSAKFQVVPKSESFFFKVTQVSYVFNVNDLRTRAQRELTLSSFQEKRFQPYIIYIAAIGLWGILILRRKKHHSDDDRSLDFAIPIIFCYLSSSVNEAGVGTIGIPSIGILFGAIILLCIRIKPGMLFFLWISFLFAFYYLVIKVLMAQWDAALTILVLMGMASPFFIRFLIHVPYFRSIIINMKKIEQFYLERFDLIQKNKLITYLPNKTWLTGGTKLGGLIQSDLMLYFGWVLSQFPLAIAIQLVREFMDPGVYYLIRSNYAHTIIGVTVLKGVFGGFLGVLPSLMAITFFCVRPITLFRVSNLSDVERKKAVEDIYQKEYLKIAPGYVSKVSILLGSLLTVAYFLPWINLQSLSAYFEVPIWQYLEPGSYSGFMLVKSMSDHQWLHYLWPSFTIALALYGLVLPYKTQNRFPSLLKLPYFLFSTAKEGVFVVANLTYIILPSILLVCLFLVPIYLGMPGFIKWGGIITTVSLLFLQLTLHTMEINKTRRYVNNFFTTILLVAFLFGAYQVYSLQAQFFQDIRTKGMKFSGFENALGYFVTTTFFADKTKQMPDASKGFTVIPAGDFMAGDIGNILYSHYDRSKKPSGKWKHLDQFEINQHEVTISEYQSFLESAEGDKFDHPSQPPAKKTHLPSYWNNKGHVPKEWTESGITQTSTLPVVGVDWWDAYAYCNWAGGALPTTDQWEKAYRGINGKYWPWGNSDLKIPQANTCVGDLDDGYEFASPAGAFKTDRSFFQVYDLAGNVSEWCQNPEFDAKSKQPVKGFHFEDRFRTGTTPAIRTDYLLLDDRSSHTGFRCVMNK